VEARIIRSKFLEFFADRGHRVVASSTLVPQDDPTLLVTNAGMNQFKGVFLGLEHRDYRRAASVQKCMRVSGKHNDLEEVGKDARHHTFFEMLGNWSFGDYGKRDSLAWGLEFLVGVMGLDPSRLWFTVYKDDDEAYDVFANDLGLAPSRILRLGDIAAGDEENFWSMADTGPCGPCAEIHYDQGEAMRCNHPDGCALGVCECDRWLELWNHVFMEFNRDEQGRLHPLPMKSVDTGLGFERLVAVTQGATSNYATDLFAPLIARAAQLSGREPEGADRISMQVIADHARAVAFTVTDGAIPSNDGRGYVVRRILRRAARHGHLLGLETPFLHDVAAVVIDEMGDAYPELRERRERTLRIILQEEERFLRTLASGLRIYGEFRARMSAEGCRVVSGDDAFKLHDTFGFPLDLTAVMAQEDGFTVDHAGFTASMERQRAQSGRERVYMAGIGPWEALRAGEPLKGRFTGDTTLSGDAQPLAVRVGGADDLGPVAHILFDASPFYPEGGGQIGDRGTITLQPSGEVLEVLATVKAEEGPALVVRGDAADLHERLGAGDTAHLTVNAARRWPTMRHHTATHLLHAALREVLGGHVEQAGSEVTPERLRFDFRHDRAVTADELARVQDLVDRAILDNRAVIRREDVPVAEAKAAGAMALFGEKYGDRVRMIEIHGGALVTADGPADSGPLVSLELCGGTHCLATGDIGPFRIISEGSVAAGARRIEAVAGEAALRVIREEQAQLRALAQVLRPEGLSYAEQVRALLAERDAARRELSASQQADAQASLADHLANPREVAGLRLVAAEVAAEDRDQLLALGDHVRDSLGSGAVVVLGAVWGGKATVVVTLAGDVVAAGRLHAGNVVKALAETVGGRGGGKPNTAQAGLPDASRLGELLAGTEAVVVAQAAG
jgi:alanyl-tRNA synthetase